MSEQQRSGGALVDDDDDDDDNGAPHTKTFMYLSSQFSRAKQFGASAKCLSPFKKRRRRRRGN